MSGQLEHASLQIRSRLISNIFVPSGATPFFADVDIIGTISLTNTMVEFGVTGEELVADHTDTANLRHFYMMILQKCTHEEIEEENDDDTLRLAPCVEGILLVSKPGCDDVFERAGWFRSEKGSTVPKILEEYETVENRVITLV